MSDVPRRRSSFTPPRPTEIFLSHKLRLEFGVSPTGAAQQARMRRLPDTYDKVTREKRGCSGHGAVTEDLGSGGRPVLQNDVYNCGCTGSWTGPDCADPVVDSAKTIEITFGAVAALAIAIGLALVYRLRHRPEDVSATHEALMQSLEG